MIFLWLGFFWEEIKNNNYEIAEKPVFSGNWTHTFSHKRVKILLFNYQTNQPSILYYELGRFTYIKFGPKYYNQLDNLTVWLKILEFKAPLLKKYRHKWWKTKFQSTQKIQNFLTAEWLIFDILSSTRLLGVSFVQFLRWLNQQKMLLMNLYIIKQSIWNK